MKSILEFNADNNGVKDNSSIIENALIKERELFFPKGKYLISKELILPSDTHLLLDKEAELFCMDNCFDKEGVRAAITNSDYENGNKNIIIEGGIFNGNNHNNRRETWNNGPCQGLLFSFFNVKGLTIKNVVATDSESYHFRIGFVTDFVFENILIKDSLLTPCQDGIHIGGGCGNGVIKNVFAEKGATNDDLIAFNADDVNFYCHNWGMKDAPIYNVSVENVSAEDCWSAVRLLSVTSRISNIHIKNLTAGIREMGVNMDAARYAADAIFSDNDYPEGVGFLENITLENFSLWHSKNTENTWSENREQRPLIVAETNCKNLVFKNFKRIKENEYDIPSPTCMIRNINDAEIIKNGEKINLKCKDTLTFNDEFIEKLEINSIK